MDERKVDAAQDPKEVVRALRCSSQPNTDCIGEACPFYVLEDVPDDMALEIGRVKWPSCDVDRIGMMAAEMIERMMSK